MKDILTQTPRADYDYSKLIEITKNSLCCTDFTSFISNKIDEYRRKYCDGEARYCTRETLAKAIGIETSTLTKIINNSQTTRKRDLIIALCFLLKLNVDEANTALNLYLMAPLNHHNLRDLVIEQALNERCDIPDLNYILVKYNFPKLDIVRRSQKDPSTYYKKDNLAKFYYSVPELKYEEESVDVQPYCVAADDSACSLHERYRPDQYDYHGEMIIHNKEKPYLKYRITAMDKGTYEIGQQKNDGWIHLYSNVSSFFNIPSCDDTDLLNEVSRLQEYIDQKARYIYSICADTRHYISRIDAINDNGKLVIYGERFGADAPELCEYFQVEITNDGLSFSISNQSVFMEQYLGAEGWMKLYGAPQSPQKQQFTSLEQVHNNRWRSHFHSLINEAQDLLIQLQERRLFLFNAHAWIEIDELMHLYKVEKAFHCIQPDDMPYEIIPQKDSILGGDGKPITVEDLYRAAELDIYSIDELCDIREKYGSLEGLLKIDALTNQKGN